MAVSAACVWGGWPHSHQRSRQGCLQQACTRPAGYSIVDNTYIHTSSTQNVVRTSAKAGITRADVRHCMTGSSQAKVKQPCCSHLLAVTLTFPVGGGGPLCCQYPAPFTHTSINQSTDTTHLCVTICKVIHGSLPMDVSDGRHCGAAAAGEQERGEKGGSRRQTFQYTYCSMCHSMRQSISYRVQQQP